MPKVDVPVVQEIALQTEDLLLPAGNADDVDINLEEILASVTGGGAPPVLTKQVLDKLLAAAAAAAAAKLSAVRNHPPEEVRSSLPNLNEAGRNDASLSRPSPNSDSSPTDLSLPDAGCPPRKSNLSGKIKGQGQLSVRFDPKQVGT